MVIHSNNKELCKKCAYANIVLVVDQCYSHFLCLLPSILAANGLLNRALIFRSFYIVLALPLLMSSSEETQSTTALIALESKLDILIDQYQCLKLENQSLKMQLQALIHENATLLEKNHQATDKVETIIARLKAMEKDA